jgi:H+-transporting ATPase
MLIVLSVALGVTAQQLAKHKTIVTRITAVEELAGVTILCSDKTIRSPRTSLRLIDDFDL